MPRTRLLGYAPDADKMTAGVITDCNSAVPSLRGMAGAPGPITGALPALAAACRGAAVGRKLDETTRFFAGTSTKLYEAGASSWTDRSRGASTYTALASGYRWSFAQFGNVSLAAQKSDLTQFSSSGAFADISSSPQAVPKASIVETVGQFVFLFDTTEATYGDSPDRWWCCATGNYADWNVSVTTECASGRLISAPGPIRAARRFGEQIAVYKGRSMYLGTYQGAPDIWRFDEMPGEAGAASQESVVNVGTDAYPKHIFMGLDDFYVFDGARPVPIGIGSVREQVFNEVSFDNIRLCAASHDPVKARVYFYYPTGTTLNRCVVYNYKTKQWGRDDREIECPATYISPGLTYDGLGTLYSTYADLPNVSYDSAFLSANAPTIAIFNTSHVIQTLNGASTTSYIRTNELGDEATSTLLDRVRPLFLTAPMSSTMTNHYKANIGDAWTIDDTVPFSSGKYDILRSSRWHRLQFNFVGDWEMAQYNAYAQPDGER